MVNRNIDSIKFTYLPQDLRAVEKAVGRAVAVKLPAMHGGKRVSIPDVKELREDHPLVADFGREIAKKILAAFHETVRDGNAVQIPVADKEFRFRSIFRLFANGFKPDDIAHELAIDRGTVFKYIREMRQAGVIPVDPLEWVDAATATLLTTLHTLRPSIKNTLALDNIAFVLMLPNEAIKAFFATLTTKDLLPCK